jgi:hypothetical protein
MLARLGSTVAYIPPPSTSEQCSYNFLFAVQHYCLPICRISWSTHLTSAMVQIPCLDAPARLTSPHFCTNLHLITLLAGVKHVIHGAKACKATLTRHVSGTEVGHVRPGRPRLPEDCTLTAWKRYMSSNLYSILQLQHLSTPTLSVLVAITLSSVLVTTL